MAKVRKAERERALQEAAQCWCDKKTEKIVMDTVLADAFAKRLIVKNSLLEMAWVIIANAGGGNWKKESKDWQEAAAKWRDDYHKKNKGVA